MTILTTIQHLLDQSDQSSSLHESTEQIPYERLLLAIGENILEITTHPESFTMKKQREDSYHLIQFQITLPVQVSSDTFNQVSTALHFFNRLLHCPGFELDELNDEIMYRYNWFIKEKGIDAFLLMQVINNIRLSYDMFSPYIIEISNGVYTLEDLLEKVTSLVHPSKKSH